jgi:hypothetical protein
VRKSKFDVDLLEAMDMLDVPEEVLGRMAAEGKLTTRRRKGTIYFSVEEIDEIIDREIEEECSKDVS